MLTVSQSNALVYSALSAFFLVGLYAGWRTKNKQDFLSGIRTQSGELLLKVDRYRMLRTGTDSESLTFPTAFPLALNWFASSQLRTASAPHILNHVR